jgi:DNA-binding CsgD family transcriptional regulator
MGRPPEVFVRPVTMAEGRRLQRIGRTAKHPVKLRRAIVVWMLAQGQSVPDIAHLLGCSPGRVRWQATKTWKAYTDPDFVSKMRRVLDLYDHPPADGPAICADEFGPPTGAPAECGPCSPPST